MSKQILAGLAILGLTVAAVFYATRDTEPTPEELTNELVALMEKGDEAGAARLIEQSAERRMNGDIEVNGIVQDETGHPLSGVKVTFQETHLATNPSNARVAHGEQIVDGEFELECDDCSAIEADFRKDGYHATAREWIAFGPDSRTPGLVDRSAVVTLHAKGTPARLERFYGTLETGGRTRVLPFSFGMGNGIMSPERVATRAESENVQNPLYLQLVVDTDADGAIRVEQTSRPGMSYTMDRPRNPRLDFGNADGGVILYEPKEKNVRLIEREMSRAPSSGYVGNLNLTRLDGLPQHFYCRIGDRYGRGMVNSVGLSGTAKHPPTAKVSVAIKLNAVAGDTNLTP